MTQEQEPPPWLTAAVDQRLALMVEMMGPGIHRLGEYGIAMTPLTEPGEGATKKDMDRWERECDNCGAYCPPGVDFYTGHASRQVGATQVVFMFGACGSCVEAPDGD